VVLRGSTATTFIWLSERPTDCLGDYNKKC